MRSYSVLAASNAARAGGIGITSAHITCVNRGDEAAGGKCFAGLDARCETHDASRRGRHHGIGRTCSQHHAGSPDSSGKIATGNAVDYHAELVGDFLVQYDFSVFIVFLGGFAFMVMAITPVLTATRRKDGYQGQYYIFMHKFRSFSRKVTHYYPNRLAPLRYKFAIFRKK